MEKAAVVITGLFTLALMVRFAWTRHLFLLWAVGFMAIAMSREIHFTGSDEILLIGWPTLMGIAVWRYDLFKSYLMNPVLINLLAGGILLYFLSRTIDQRWWKGLAGENVVFVRLEELIELLGHCTVGSALLFSKEVRHTLKKMPLGNKWVSDHNTWKFWFLPSYVCIPAAALTLLVRFFKPFLRAVPLPHLTRLGTGELREYHVALFLCIYLLSFWFRIRKGSAK
jgi:hypothetical protein